MKQITKFLLIGFLVACLGSCNSGQTEIVPIDMQPNWEDVSMNDFPVKLGQVLKFKINAAEFSAIVLDFNEEEGTKWLGLCFIKGNDVFGRQIPNGLINTTCLDLLDFSYLKLEGLQNFQVVQSYSINKSKVGIGSMGTAKNVSELLSSYEFGILQRKKKQTPCAEGLVALDAVRACYFGIEKIVNQSE